MTIPLKKKYAQVKNSLTAILIRKNYLFIIIFGVFHSKYIKNNYKHKYANTPIPSNGSKKQAVKKNYSYNSMSKKIFPIR